MPPLGMWKLIQPLLVATVVSVVAVGLLVGQFDFEEVKKKAEQGDADSQYILGFMYNNGQGVPQDHAEAVKWFRLAAEQGTELSHSPGLRNAGRIRSSSTRTQGVS